MRMFDEAQKEKLRYNIGALPPYVLRMWSNIRKCMMVHVENYKGTSSGLRHLVRHRWSHRQCPFVRMVSSAYLLRGPDKNSDTTSMHCLCMICACEQYPKVSYGTWRKPPGNAKWIEAPGKTQVVASTAPLCENGITCIYSAGRESKNSATTSMHCLYM